MQMTTPLSIKTPQRHVAPIIKILQLSHEKETKLTSTPLLSVDVSLYLYILILFSVQYTVSSHKFPR